jgi:serine phosphatase RsbU (regulator of sigma subunit)
MDEDAGERVRALEAENRSLRVQLESKARLANRALAAYQQRVERLAEALARLEERDRRLSEDLEEARRFQASLLSLPPRLPGLEVAALYRPADQVGGDLYDVTVLPDGTVRAFIADATGHGVQAALRTMILKSEYDQLRTQIVSPARLLEALSERLSADYPGLELRASAACLDVLRDRAGATLRYASFAHPPLILIDGGELAEIYRPGPFLALSDGARAELVERRVAPRARLLLYTDGVVEQWSPAGASFGLGPLIEAARTPGPLGELVRAFEARLLEFVGARGLSDDAAAVFLELRD